MSKRIAAVVAAVLGVGALGMAATPVRALPGCVATTVTPTCQVATSGELLEVAGRAEYGHVVVYDANGRQLSQWSWGTGLLALAYTDEVFETVPGGHAVLTLSGVGAAFMGDA